MIKRMFAMVMAVVMTMSVGTNAYAREIGEAEKAQLLKGTYEVVALHKGANLERWTEPDFWGDQYMLFTYTEGAHEEIVCLKYHLTRDQLRNYRSNRK